MGRSSPEIDIFEATIDGTMGKVCVVSIILEGASILICAVGIPIGSMGAFQCSSCILSYLPTIFEANSSQAEYRWQNTSDNLGIYDPEVTVLNSYVGGM